MCRYRLMFWRFAAIFITLFLGINAHGQIPDSCLIEPGDFCTYTQGGWGQDNCRGNNVACLRNQYWYDVFPNGTVTIGGGFTIRFTSSAAVAAYLPRGTTPGVLTQSYLNPTFPTSAGIFASQVLALQLNVSFADAEVGNMHDLGDLLIATGPFEGFTVDELLALANAVLGGNLSALPPGTTLGDLNTAADMINNNFDGCSANNGYLERECEECAAPVVTAWTGNPTTFQYGLPVTVCVTVADPDNDLDVVTARYVFGSCDETVPAVFGNDRWCVTVPASCTDACARGMIIFTATDSCELSDVDTVYLDSSSQPPVVECWSGNPLQYQPGQPLTVCAAVTDPDNNVTGVTAHFVIGTCDQTAPAVFASGLWCVTIPAGCTVSCEPAIVIFTATDACELTSAPVTCVIPALNTPPEISCAPGPVSYNFGQPVTVCAIVSDFENNLLGVNARYSSPGGCDITVPAVDAGGLWCVTIPETCTRECYGLVVEFIATDACGLISAPAVCTLVETHEPFSIQCGPDLPPFYAFGEPLTVCADLFDPSGIVDSVLVQYAGTLCNTTARLESVGGRYCVTIPPSCTQSYDPIFLSFLAFGHCFGEIASAECVVPGCPGVSPEIACAPQNPRVYLPGQPVTVCAVVTDPDNDVTSVIATYTLGDCIVTGPASESGPGLWCVTVPGTCTIAADLLTVHFVVTDLCARADSVDCILIPEEETTCGPVEIECWSGNPISYEYGASLTVCAVLTDPEEDLDSVRVRYLTEDCNVTTVPIFSSGRWCVTIPGTCTESLNEITVIFTAVDSCGDEHDDTCYVGSEECIAPTAQCWSGNPTHYTYGGEFTLCIELLDPDNTVTGVTAHVTGELCDEDLPTTPGGPLWCATIPASCTQSSLPIVVVFTALSFCGPPLTVTCTINPPTENECCFWCDIEPAFVTTSRIAEGSERTPLNAVIELRDNGLHLAWNPLPGTDYYLVFAGALNADLEDLSVAAFCPPEQCEWTEGLTLDDLPDMQFYQVVAYQVTTSSALTESDRARWEFNEGAGDTAHDYSGFARDAWRWPVCPPDWGNENDPVCNEAYTEFMEFDGYIYNPERCIEHLRAANDTAFYRDRFQVWARIRIHDHPTTDTGPYYIISTHSLSLEVGGGFALRLDPGWVERDGVREWHNRLTGLVWDRTLNSGAGGFRSIISPPPTLDDTTTYSVPLNQWSCISMIVDGANSMLLIDGRVVAAGNLRYRSDNNNVPVIIGAGYRHHTYPIEYPFFGEMDCLRVTDLP